MASKPARMSRRKVSRLSRSFRRPRPSRITSLAVWYMPLFTRSFTSFSSSLVRDTFIGVVVEGNHLLHGSAAAPYEHHNLHLGPRPQAGLGPQRLLHDASVQFHGYAGRIQMQLL